MSYESATQDRELGALQLEALAPAGPSDWDPATEDHCPHAAVHGRPPWKDDQEWANALTHAIAAIMAAAAGIYLVQMALLQSPSLAVACAVYAASALGTFLFSTLSHFVRRQPLLNIMRSWDQAMIYAMISGTYTPIVYQYAHDTIRVPLLSAIWIAAAAGFLTKVAVRHRINSIGSVSYLLLGWLPAIPLAGQVPAGLVGFMLAGGVVYTVGVVLLMNDGKLKYLHAGWHISVLTAAAIHYLGILCYVVLA